MGWSACATAIKNAAGGILSDDELEEIISRIQARTRFLQGQQSLGTTQAMAQAAREIGDEVTLQAKIEKRNALLNLQARIARRARIEAAPNYFDGIRAELHGINTPIHGGRFSAQAEWNALKEQYWSGMTAALERAGLFETVRSGRLEQDWARELFELSKGEDGKPGITHQAEALKIARIVHEWQTLAKKNLNDAGAWIGDYAGYITRTAHDPDRIRAAGFQAWRDVIEPRLDPRTFEGVEDRTKFLKNVYDNLVTGVHLTEEGGVQFKDPAFTGPANLAKKVSQARKLHFSDADGWLQYQQRFGNGTVLSSILNSLDRAARSTAIMRRWGTNPRDEFQRDIRYLRETHKGDERQVDATRLGIDANALQNRFDLLDGTANQPVNQLGAKVGQVARLTQSMAKLGGVLFTHLSVGMTKAAELRHHGVGFLESYSDFLQSMVRGRGKGETRQIMDLLGAGMEGMHGSLLGRFEADDTLPGTLSKLSNVYFKATGLTYMFDAQKAGAMFVLSRHLGGMLDRQFGALPAATQRALDRYGITADEWEALRGVTDHATSEGRKFLTPDAATRAGLDHKAGDDLAMKLHAYFEDSARRAMITPGIEERAILLRGTRPGTPEGEALRFFAQFKTWPTALITQGIGRELFGAGPLKQNLPAAIGGILHMAVAGAVFGYLRMAITDLFKGRDPRDPNDPKTWLAALQQGGGVGILGDYLFGEYSRFGNNFSEALLGPVVGATLGSVVDLWNRAKEGKDLKPEAFKLMIDNTPFLNLFYARTALNYLFLWQIQEALNPGYQRRYERRIEQQNGQSFWISPAARVAGQDAFSAPRFSHVDPTTGAAR